MIEGLDVKDPSIRSLDQSRIGPVLTGDPRDIGDGPPVTAMLIQNTNPVTIAPEQRKVKAGFARDDLFTCVHEQFMTETARMADIVLPATMFLEHDDHYHGGGHQHIMYGPKLIDPPGECRTNHDVHCALARRVGAEHPGFAMTAARADRLDAEGVGLGRHRAASRRQVDRLPAGFRHLPLRQRLHASRWQVSLQTGLDRRTYRQHRKPWTSCSNAGTAGPLGGAGGDGHGTSIPIGHGAVAQLSELEPSMRCRPLRRRKARRPR